MLILAMLAGRAEAGLLVGATAGPAVPIQLDTDSPRGMSIGGVVGYRLSVGPLHVRPDAIYRYNTSARASALGVGGAVTLGAPIAFGPYAHVAVGLGNGGALPVGDAGLLAEIGLLKPLHLGVSAGWEKTTPTGQLDLRDIECPAGTTTCGPRYAANWFVARATIGLSL
jgi:hypothetical protein